MYENLARFGPQAVAYPQPALLSLTHPAFPLGLTLILATTPSQSSQSRTRQKTKQKQNKTNRRSAARYRSLQISHFRRIETFLAQLWTMSMHSWSSLTNQQNGGCPSRNKNDPYSSPFEEEETKPSNQSLPLFTIHLAVFFLEADVEAF